MLQFCLAAIAGIAACSLLPALPSRDWLPWTVLVATLLAPHRAGRILGAGLCGALYFWLAADAVLQTRLADEQSGNKFTFTAEIIDFTRLKGTAAQLLVAPDSPALPPRIRLSWYRAAAIPRLGEAWEIEARLRRPRGSHNPGGFDFAGWLHRERIGASGYVLSAHRLGDEPVNALARWRQRIAERITDLLPRGDARAAMLAIAIGARHEINADAWGRYAATGTSHLMAISGLHVGLAATAAGVLAWSLCGLLCPRRNLRDIALLAAVPAAATYTAIAGFAVPAQRALLMTLAAAMYLWLRQPLRPFRVLAFVALAILIADPLAVMTPGYLLSFGAVSVLLCSAGRQLFDGGEQARSVVQTWLKQLGVMQAVLLLGLLPLTGLLFARVAWLAPLANVLVLPLFSLITVPAALLGMLFEGPVAPVGDALLWLAWFSLAAVHGVIFLLATVPGSSVTLAQPAGFAYLAWVLPLLWVLLPPGFPGRYIAWLSFAATLMYRPLPTPTGCVDVHTLDVGQGLAVVVRTHQRTLLFDTGPAYGSGASSAERVILPFLASQGLQVLDTVIVSHADQDHAGGLPALLGGIRVDRLLGGERLHTARPQQRCTAGLRWSWDGIGFAILHPQAGSRLDGNNASCVLEVSAGSARVLLTGDIEAPIEKRLISGGELRPVLLAQVPHHGSRTSSSADFIRVLAADSAVVSTGFRNRWGFPKEDVSGRWQASGSRILNTATSGAIHHRLCPDSGLSLVSEHRLAARRYWHDRD